MAWGLDMDWVSVGGQDGAGSESQSSSQGSPESRREILHSECRPPNCPVGGLLSPRTPYRGALIPGTPGMSAPHEALGPVSEAAGAVTENPARLRPDLADLPLLLPFRPFCPCSLIILDHQRPDRRRHGTSRHRLHTAWLMVTIRSGRPSHVPFCPRLLLRTNCRSAASSQQPAASTSKPQSPTGLPLVSPAGR